jgi:hypothetical protein
VYILNIKMSSSRSIAAARARRAGEQAPPVSGTRPGTSINSHAAFAPQQPMHPYQNMPPAPSNIRIGKSGQSMPPPPVFQPAANGLPFSKLSVSDAIGLITLRLGSVEQFIMEFENSEHNTNSDGTINLPDNSKLIDNSVLTSIMNRLDSIEKKDTNNNYNSDINKEIGLLKELTNNHKELLFKLERDLVETKDILKTLNNTFDAFTKNTNDRFIDYEYAIAELEKNILITDNNVTESYLETFEENLDNNEETDNINVDLKSIIRQELANETN